MVQNASWWSALWPTLPGLAGAAVAIVAMVLARRTTMDQADRAELAERRSWLRDQRLKHYLQFLEEATRSALDIDNGLQPGPAGFTHALGARQRLPELSNATLPLLVTATVEFGALADKFVPTLAGMVSERIGKADAWTDADYARCSEKVGDAYHSLRKQAMFDFDGASRT